MGSIIKQIRMLRIVMADAAAILSPVGHPAAKPRAVVIRLDAIGDFALWVDCGESLSQYLRSKGYEVGLVTTRSCAELAAGLGIADEIITMDPRRLATDMGYRYAVLRNLRHRRFEIAISPALSRQFFITDCLVRATGAPIRIGSQGDLANIRAWQRRISDRWFTQLVPASARPLHELERNAEFLTGLEIPVPGAPSALRRLAGRLATESQAIDRSADIYLVAPGAGWFGRQWPIDHFVKVLDHLYRATGWAGVICGGSADTPSARHILEKCDAPLRDWTGKTSLTQALSLCAQARLLLGNDTGLIHLGAAVGVPTVAILGGGRFGRFLPYPERPQQGQHPPLCIYHHMDCYGCEWACRYPLPEHSPVPCIKSVQPDTVWAAIQTFISDARDRTTEMT